MLDPREATDATVSNIPAGCLHLQDPPAWAPSIQQRILRNLWIQLANHLRQRENVIFPHRARFFTRCWILTINESHWADGAEGSKVPLRTFRRVHFFFSFSWNFSLLLSVRLASTFIEHVVRLPNSEIASMVSVYVWESNCSHCALLYIHLSTSQQNKGYNLKPHHHHKHRHTHPKP